MNTNTTPLSKEQVKELLMNLSDWVNDKRSNLPYGFETIVNMYLDEKFQSKSDEAQGLVKEYGNWLFKRLGLWHIEGEKPGDMAERLYNVFLRSKQEEKRQTKKL